MHWLSYQLSKRIAKLITPLSGQTPSFVKNSQHFVEFVKDIELRSNEVMVSFDVKSLFTTVPVDEAIEVILQKLSEDKTLEDRTALSPEQITKLLELCLRTTYFSFRGEFYRQRDGAAMGSPVSPVVANIYMEMFEEMVLGTSQQPPTIWKRYVDDTFRVMDGRHVNGFLEHINSQRPSIKFTMERGNDMILPFLDTLLTRKEDRKLDISVYRKPTHTDRYLQYSSHHPLHVRRGVVLCLFQRARTIAVGDNMEREEKHLV